MTKLQKAVAAIKAGDKQVGEQLVRDILATEPDNEAAWLWLATVVNSRNEKIRCLARVLEINPDNDTAQQGIARLQAASVPAASPAKPDDAPHLKRLKKAPQAATSAENAGLPGMKSGSALSASLLLLPLSVFWASRKFRPVAPFYGWRSAAWSQRRWALCSG